MPPHRRAIHEATCRYYKIAWFGARELSIFNTISPTPLSRRGQAGAGSTKPTKGPADSEALAGINKPAAGSFNYTTEANAHVLGRLETKLPPQRRGTALRLKWADAISTLVAWSRRRRDSLQMMEQPILPTRKQALLP